MSHPLETCALCPRLCRPACPVSTGTGREAAVPTFLARMGLEHARGRVDDALAEAALTLCVDCGACEAHCHVHQPLPELLRDARRAVAVSRPVEPIEKPGPGTRVLAVEADERPLHRVVERLLGEPVAAWPTRNQLGVAYLHTDAWPSYAAVLRDLVAGRHVVTADGQVSRVLTEAGIEHQLLQELTEIAGDTGSCVMEGQTPLACCGGAAPLTVHHPEDAQRVAKAFARRWEGRCLSDAACKRHLEQSGVPVKDLLDRLLETP